MFGLEVFLAHLEEAENFIKGPYTSERRELIPRFEEVV